MIKLIKLQLRKIQELLERNIFGGFLQRLIWGFKHLYQRDWTNTSLESKDLFHRDQLTSVIASFKKVESVLEIGCAAGPNYNGITYMPPHIAQKVISNSIVGRASAKIPNLIDSFNCMVFHALYHKGFQSGLPSAYGVSDKIIINNDYLSLIKKHGTQLDLAIDYDMESLDEYMLNIKWRPTLDVLLKTSKWNKWVRIHHFSKSVTPFI